MAGKGFEYYRNNYTHEQLWNMLVTSGDSWSVEQAASVWRQARMGIEDAESNLNTAMSEVAGYWQGEASDEFQRRMEILQEYGHESIEGMSRAEYQIIPALATYLKDAQDKAASQDLYPENTLTDYADWLEQTKPEDLHYGSDKEQTQRSKLQREHQDYIESRHDAMAHIVADLGDQYQEVTPDDWRNPPPPPPSDMPGNENFQPPTGGVFGSSGLGPTGGAYASGGPGSVPGSDGSFAGGGNQFAGGGEFGSDDLEPVDGWAPSSYGDLDSNFEVGALQSGGPGAGPIGPGGGPGPTSMGGGTPTGAGPGLFGPGRGGGASSAPGRGTGTNSPARSGATKSTGPANNTRGSGARGRGGTSTGRPGASSRGVGPRGGTRSGYNDDDEEEEYTRETWLKEDDVDWGRNQARDEELDD